MNQIPTQFLKAAGPARTDGPEASEEQVSERLIAAIDEAVDHLKALVPPSPAPLSPAPKAAPAEPTRPGGRPVERVTDRIKPQHPPLAPEPAASPADGPDGSGSPTVVRVSPEALRAPDPGERPRPATPSAPVAPDARAPEPGEAPIVEPVVEPVVEPAPAPRAKIGENGPMPLGKTIEGHRGPIRENERREGPGGRGPDDGTGGGGGGGGGGGNGGARFHKRSGPVNFAASLAKGIAAVRRNLVIVMVFTLAINVLVLAIPIYLFQISDRVLNSRSIDTLVMLTIAVVGAILLQVALDAIRRFILMRTAVELEVQLGAPILSAAARASLHGTGKDYQVLSDLQQLRSFLNSGTLISFLDAPLMPLFVVVVYLVHPHMGIIVMTCCAVLFVIAWLNQRFTGRHYGEANVYLSKANLHLDSMTRNSQIINALAMIPEAVRMWGQDIAGSLKAQVRAQDRNIMFSSLSKLCRLLTQVTLLGWGAHLSLSGELTGGMVIAASIISGRALAPVEGAIEGWNQFNHSKNAYLRIRQLLLTSPLNFPRLRLPQPQGRLDVERVLFVPPPQKKVILNGISFSLKPGESLAIIGNSGSGKTTLGKMLVGSIMPTSGNVRLDLMDLRNWDQRQFGENIGYLPQDVQLFPGTIKANIARMRDDVDDQAIFEAAVLADVHELIASFPQGYETMVSADGAPLSGGQKQRIALARAFFGNPRFVVLDEPNSNLDSAGEAALAKAILRARETGITTVTITQRPALLQCVDKIMLLKDGTVAMFGERQKVLAALNANRNGKNDGARKPPQIEGQG